MKISITLFVFLVLLSSCRKKDFTIDNLNNNKIIALGHGGMGIGAAYPIDSYESIAKCLDINKDGSEFDIQMTKDSVLVVFHDLELSGRSNKKGKISDLNWEDMKDASYTQLPFSSYSIISLDQLLANIKDRESYTLTFDIKTDSTREYMPEYYTAYARAISAIIQKYRLEKNVCIETYNGTLLETLQGMNPAYKLFIYANTFETAYEIATQMNLYGITLSTRAINKQEVRRAHDAGLYVAIWNIHSQKDNREAIEKSPDFIQTDKLRDLLRLLK